MLFRFFLLLIGFGLAVGGGVTMILYLNYIPLGFRFLEYVFLMVKRVEFYLFLGGIFMIWVSVMGSFHHHKNHC